MHQVAQFCEKHQQTYFGKCPQCPDLILSTTSSPALQVTEQADKEIFDKYDLMMEVKALQSELQKLREERDSALRSKEKAIKELLDRIKSGSDVWNELKKQQPEGEMPQTENPLASYWFEKSRTLLVERNEFKGQFFKFQAEIQKLREERDSATASERAVLELMVERDKAFNAMRNALVELLADIRRKPNDTRYATQMRRAQEVLDKYPFIAKR